MGSWEQTQEFNFLSPKHKVRGFADDLTIISRYLSSHQQVLETTVTLTRCNICVEISVPLYIHSVSPASCDPRTYIHKCRLCKNVGHSWLIEQEFSVPPSGAAILIIDVMLFLGNTCYTPLYVFLESVYSLFFDACCDVKGPRKNQIHSC